MRQLDPHDASFLYSETEHANANVTLIHIYDQSTAPGGKVRFKSILAQIERKLEHLPVLRQKLRQVPLSLDYPYWVDDEHFDLEYHVRHIALPKPGDWRQFCIQVSRLHARPLDLNRPLWEVYVIEGLDGFADLPEGSFALITKTHHAVLDVEHGSDFTLQLHDTDPQAALVPAPPPAPWFPDDPPGALRMVASGAANSLRSAVRIARPLGRVLRHWAPSALSLAGDLLRRPQRMPGTRFNSEVSPHRVFETRRFALSEFKEIRTLVPGANVNDVVLAVCGGGLRRYLEHHAELPENSLKAIAPFYVRTSDDGPGDPPRLSWMRVRLGTDLADPVARLKAICEQSRSSAVAASAVRAQELTDISRHVPAGTLALSAKLLARATARLGRRSPIANCTITNVPGPEQPLYLCGARMTYFSALMPIADGMGLVLAVTSYDGRIVVSPTSCRDLMPDPEVFAQCLRDSFQEYLAAARAPAPRTRARARPRVTSAATAAVAAAKPPAVRPAPRPRSAAGRRSAASRAG